MAKSKKMGIYIAEGADHGLAFPIDRETYYAHLSAFENENGIFE